MTGTILPRVRPIRRPEPWLLMDAARVLARYAPRLPHTIRFALWSAEEIGLIGSTQYV